jgi:RHS repeat-associated protein
MGIYSGALAKETIPLPGGETAVYNGSGLNFIRHADWLGSSRLATTWAHAVYSKEAYAPFGETYNEAGAPDRSFTGQDQDVVTGSGGTGVYDFLFRKYDPSAGRWLSPDPLGWGAVDQTTPQSLNRYAYVEDNPMSQVDPNGLNLCYYGDLADISVDNDPSDWDNSDNCAEGGGVSIGPTTSVTVPGGEVSIGTGISVGGSGGGSGGGAPSNVSVKIIATAFSVWNALSNPSKQMCHDMDKLATGELATATLSGIAAAAVPVTAPVTVPAAWTFGAFGASEKLYVVSMCP